MMVAKNNKICENVKDLYKTNPKDQFITQIRKHLIRFM